MVMIEQESNDGRNGERRILQKYKGELQGATGGMTKMYRQSEDDIEMLIKKDNKGIPTDAAWRERRKKEKKFQGSWFCLY